MMHESPYGWDQEFAKRMALIGYEVLPSFKEQVSAKLDETLRMFEHRDYDDRLIDDIETAMRKEIDLMYNAGWLE